MREVTINGKTVKFDIDKRVPEKGSPAVKGTKPKSEFRLILEAMQPGDSWKTRFDAKTAQTRSSLLAAVQKATGKRYCYRAEGKGTRYYCLETPKLRAVA